MSGPENKGGLVIPDRPQISVELVNSVELQIVVAGIAPGFETVEINTVVIPLDCAEQVAKAMLELVKA